jgi:hypothetical protein
MTSRMLLEPSLFWTLRLTQKSAMPDTTGQAESASQLRSPVASQYCHMPSAMSEFTCTSSLPVRQQLGVSSSPDSALSHGNRAPW